ncbi:hypothetical protein H4R20_001010 [Coemansia guatemalensis]|uniref:Secreted protein n=1 Tax=Coemansia guatemalensis TaxID=2761395 RepID=A0A9W8HY43_9FUNG|nr:hypothetical protein H4R20_001010 [Coemansia guatemalensis]
MFVNKAVALFLVLLVTATVASAKLVRGHYPTTTNFNTPMANLNWSEPKSGTKCKTTASVYCSKPSGHGKNYVQCVNNKTLVRPCPARTVCYRAPGARIACDFPGL